MLINKFLVKVESEYDTYKDGTVETQADKEIGKCPDLTSGQMIKRMSLILRNAMVEL